jgi:hypothetical protein
MLCLESEYHHSDAKHRLGAIQKCVRTYRYQHRISIYPWSSDDVTVPRRASGL